jgi:hypothetical protein
MRVVTISRYADQVPLGRKKSREKTKIIAKNVATKIRADTGDPKTKFEKSERKITAAPSDMS